VKILFRFPDFLEDCVLHRYFLKRRGEILFLKPFFPRNWRASPSKHQDSFSSFPSYADYDTGSGALFPKCLPIFRLTYSFYFRKCLLPTPPFGFPRPSFCPWRHPIFPTPPSFRQSAAFSGSSGVSVSEVFTSRLPSLTLSLRELESLQVNGLVVLFIPGRGLEKSEYAPFRLKAPPFLGPVWATLKFPRYLRGVTTSVSSFMEVLSYW